MTPELQAAFDELPGTDAANILTDVENRAVECGCGKDSCEWCRCVKKAFLIARYAIASLTQSSEALEALLQRHDEDAKKCNFTKCGCNDCKQLRPLFNARPT